MTLAWLRRVAPCSHLALFLLAAAVLGACADDLELELESPMTDGISLPVTQALVDVEFTVDVAGQGTERVGPIQISQNLGSVSVDGQSVAIFAQDYTYWETAHADVFQLVGATSDRLYSFYLYCDPTGKLTHIWHETTDGRGMFGESASGTCALSQTASRSSVSLPAVSMPPPPVVRGFTLHGAQLALEDGLPGWIYLEGRKLTLYPFASVNCTDCDTSSGWWELHSIIWDAEARQATLGVLYLNPTMPGLVTLEYTLMLPYLARPGRGTLYLARWTTPQ